jgi:drug/metabolite transporter (DMT)-like permease
MKKNDYIAFILFLAFILFKAIEQLRRHARLYEKYTGKSREVFSQENIVSYWHENWWFVLGILLFIIYGFVLYFIYRNKPDELDCARLNPIDCLCNY